MPCSSATNEPKSACLVFTRQWAVGLFLIGACTSVVHCRAELLCDTLFLQEIRENPVGGDRASPSMDLG